MAITTEVPLGTLTEVLATCTGGEVLSLAPGQHGDTTIGSGAWDDPVTITGPGQPAFVDIRGARRGLILRDLTVGAVLVRHGLFGGVWHRPREITVERVRTTTGGVQLRGVDASSVAHCLVDTGQAITLRDAVDCRVVGNGIRNQRGDGIVVMGACRDCLVEANWITDPDPAPGYHGDGIQVYGVDGQGDPRDITIRGNLIQGYVGARTFQGIFVKDYYGTGFENIIVEGNCIDTSSLHGIMFKGAKSGCVVRNNSLRGGGIISIYEDAQTGNAGLSVHGNITRKLDCRSTAVTVGDNIVYEGASVFPAERSASVVDFVPLYGAIPHDAALGAMQVMRTRAG